MRNTFAALLVFILVALLAIVYAFQPPPLAPIVVVGIVIIGVLLAFSGDTRALGVLGGIDLLLSLRVAWLIGELRFGENGGTTGLAVWMIILAIFGAVLYRNLIWVQTGTSTVIFDAADKPTRISRTNDLLVLPRVPLVERSIAAVPTYRMTGVVEVKDINTPAKHNIKRVVTRVQYNIGINQVNKVFTRFPNSGRAQEDVAKELKLSLEDARKSPSFWERLFDTEIQREVEQHLRELVYQSERFKDKTLPDGSVEQEKRPFTAQDLYLDRETIADDLWTRLHASVQEWGAEVTSVKIETVDVDGELMKRLNRDLNRELSEARHTAALQTIAMTEGGLARAEFQAQFIAKLLAAFKDNNIAVNADDIKQIVAQSMHEATAQRYRTDDLLATLLTAQQENAKN